MTNNDRTISLTDLVDGTLSGPEWDAWLAARPDAAAEVIAARRVRALVAQMRAAAFELPPDFEARLLERVRTDRTLIDLIELGLSGLGRSILEILGALLGLLPEPQPQPII